MDLEELKILLKIPKGKVVDEVLLQAQLDAAILKAQNYCRRTFIDDVGLLVLPADVKIAVRLFVEAMNSNEAIISDSVAGGFSKTLREGGYDEVAKNYLKPYRKIRYI